MTNIFLITPLHLLLRRCQSIFSLLFTRSSSPNYFLYNSIRGREQLVYGHHVVVFVVISAAIKLSVYSDN